MAVETAPPRRRGRAGRARAEGWNRSEKLLLSLGLGLPGLIMALGGWLLWANTLPPGPSTMVEEPGSAAYHALYQAGQLVVEPPRSKKAVPSPAERAGIVAANAPALALARRVQGQSFVPHLVPSYSAVFPEYTAYRSLARTFALEAEVRAERGDLSGAADSYLDAIAMGQQIGQDGLVVGRMVGIACEAIGQSGLWKLTERLDAAAARRATRRLEALARTRGPFLKVAESEARWSQAALRNALARTSTASLAAQFSGSESEQERFRLFVQGSLTSKRAILETQQRLTQQYLARLRHPWGSPARQTAAIEPLDPINRLLYPDLTGSEQSDRRAIAQSALLATRLAIRAYRLERGAEPPSLEALVERGYLPSLPTDPFTDGAPLRLKGLDPYSVGPDGRDDGGMQRKADRAPGAPEDYFGPDLRPGT